MNKNNTILEQLNASTVKLLAASTVSELCQTIVEEAKKLTDAEYGSIFLRKAGGLEIIYASFHRLKKIKYKKNGTLNTVLRTKTTIILEADNIKQTEKELGQLGIQSVIFIPLSYHAKSTGALVLYSLKKEYFTPKQLDLLTLFGSLASLAITKTRMHEETAKALEMRDRFISLASHELRTPLTSINGYIQLIHARTNKHEAIDPKWINELHTESNRFTNLVKAILDINRIKQGQVAFVFNEISLREIITKAIEESRTAQPEYTFSFIDKNPTEKYLVVGDFDRLLEMFRGLLKNAVKFSEPPSEIIITLSKTSKTLFVTITDQGKGIPKQDLSGIFEGFHKSKTVGHQGFGVGLIFAKHVIDQHRGKITIASKENEGTTLTISLPAANNIKQ